MTELILKRLYYFSELLGSEPCWQYLLASNAIPGFIQLLTLPWFPESPRYLLIDCGDKEACVMGMRAWVLIIGAVKLYIAIFYAILSMIASLKSTLLKSKGSFFGIYGSVKNI